MKKEIEESCKISEVKGTNLIKVDLVISAGKFSALKTGLERYDTPVSFDLWMMIVRAEKEKSTTG